MSSICRTRIEIAVGPIIADRFTEVTKAQLDPGHITKIKSGTFGCDDYDLLVRTIFADRSDFMEMYDKAIVLAQRLGKTGLTNQEVTNLIEGVAVLSQNENQLRTIRLKGFWRAKPPAQ